MRFKAEPGRDLGDAAAPTPARDTIFSPLGSFPFFLILSLHISSPELTFLLGLFLSQWGSRGWKLCPEPALSTEPSPEPTPSSAVLQPGTALSTPRRHPEHHGRSHRSNPTADQKWEFSLQSETNQGWNTPWKRDMQAEVRQEGNYCICKIGEHFCGEI